MYYVNDFIKDLPNILKDIKKARVFFITYKPFDGYENGIVPETPEGLTLHVCAGGFMPGLENIFGAELMSSLGDYEAEDAIWEGVKGDANSAQKVVESVIEKEIVQTEDEKLIIFNYAGLFAYRESVAYAKKIHEKVPSALIFTLTCDCEIESKEKTLNTAKESSQITDWIVTASCGGQREMTKFLEATIQSWK